MLDKGKAVKLLTAAVGDLESMDWMGMLHSGALNDLTFQVEQSAGGGRQRKATTSTHKYKWHKR